MELNQLPDELFHVLFSYLDVSTLLTNCTLVCKRWRGLIHQMRFKELHFEDYFDSFHRSFNTPLTNFWVHLPVPLDPRYQIRTRNRNFFNFPFIKMFEHLKRLRLTYTFDLATDFNKLNQFSALEELQCSIRFNERSEVTIKLPRLRLLDLSFNTSNQSKLTVDAPVKVLIGCFYVDENSLNLARPDILEEIVFLGNGLRLNFAACKNVRICRDYLQLKPHHFGNTIFSSDHLETFPNLQELHYQCSIGSSALISNSFDIAKRKISDALNRNRQQNRDVKIFFQGIRLEVESFLHSLRLEEMRDPLALQIEHYELLATNLYYYRKCDYSSLEKRFDDSLPADLFSKFTCVNTVTATGTIRHLNQFAAFLKQCKYLCELEVELDSLDQAFCDQLHENCFFLKKLVFKDRKKEEGNEGGQNPANNLNAVEGKLAINNRRSTTFKKVNFDFLAKQTNLFVFVVGEFDMDTALRCLRISPPKLDYFGFQYFTAQISIRSRNSYSLSASSILFSMESHQLSVDELTSDLGIIKQKVDSKLAKP